MLRGFLLLWMTFTHLPTKLSVVSNQTFGFVSGAEGFIFLSGFMVGWLEQRIETRRGVSATWTDIVRRTLRVYSYHSGLLAVAFLIAAPLAARYGLLALQNLLSFYLAHPKHALVAAALLDYRPSLLDILPMYVFFLLGTPFVRSVARRFGWRAALLPSAALWIAAQLGLRSWIHQHVNFLGLGVPEDSTGAFDMYAWQLLWMVALALGSKFTIPASEEVTREEFPKPVVTLAAVVAGILLVLRYCPWELWVDGNVVSWLIDKWHLGPLRVLNFAALAVLVVRFGAPLGRIRWLEPLGLLGRSSLEVFTAHVLCCLVAISLNHDGDPSVEPWQQVIVVPVTVAVLFGTALAHEQLRKKIKRSGEVAG